AEMERLYQSLYSSLAHFREYQSSAGVSTCVAYAGSEVAGIFLVRIDKDTARVLNEGIRLAEHEIAGLARFIFASFNGLRAISFHAIDAEFSQLPFPYQRYTCTEDIVLDLPDSTVEYMG